jgi:ATP-binding cassette subfamily B protein
MKVIFQHDQMDCGPACLAMIAQHYGKKFSLKSLRDNSFLTKDGVSLLGVAEAAEHIGLKKVALKTTLKGLVDLSNSYPCILHWNQNHFVVLSKSSQTLFTKKKHFHIADPSYGWVVLNEEKFKKSWLSDGEKGVALLLSPTDDFYKYEEPKEQEQRNLKLKHLTSYLKPYKRQVAVLFLTLLLGSGITFALPFLTQALIDKGINAKSFHLIAIILIAQLSLNFGSIFFEVIRNWLTLDLGTHISIAIISDFFKKILQLPLKFFDSKMMGDFSQRIQDNERIESFLTSQGLLTGFSMVTFLVFFGVLCYYDLKIMLVFVLLTLISLLWTFFWLRKRRHLDYHRFRQRAENQEFIFEMMNGVTEMKLNLFEDFKLQEWKNIQQSLYKINIKILRISQYQLSGYEFLNQLKNILVTYLAATFVINGEMTLGQLLSVSYIIGQMNGPISQLVNFFRSLQDANLSLERLNEMQNHPIEEKSESESFYTKKFDLATLGITLHNVNFQYQGPKSPFVLKNINMFIPPGKITAIVGASGSGKTTLMKLLLKFYEATSGEILLDDYPLLTTPHSWLRQNSGVVLQDGFIFSDSIERNIICGEEVVNQERLMRALTIANIKEYVMSLPLGLNTKIGAAGNGISGGQKQRILIARAVYRNPQFLFFDEATSALDAENEKVIHNHLQDFFKGKTVVIIAHRLSTVKNADQIVVLKEGKIAEQGTHNELVARRSDYYNLVKNQLELGN